MSREVFTFRSEDTELYGSLYWSGEPSPVGVVVCPAWGAEARTGERLCRSFARRVATDGGAALVFDWPGHGESDGDPENVDFESLVIATGAAVAELQERRSPERVVVAGFRLGASAASVCAANVSAEALVLLQPVWDPKQHFEEVESSSRRTALGRAAGDRWAFGFPLPSLSGFENSGTQMRAAVDRFQGATGAFGYDMNGQTPARVEAFELSGEWKQAATAGDDQLAAGAARWLWESVTS
jgi:pimeloyl-ACP methyl ester carboxylesterase